MITVVKKQKKSGPLHCKINLNCNSIYYPKLNNKENITKSTLFAESDCTSPQNWNLSFLNFSCLSIFHSNLLKIHLNSKASDKINQIERDIAKKLSIEYIPRSIINLNVKTNNKIKNLKSSFERLTVFNINPKRQQNNFHSKKIELIHSMDILIPKSNKSVNIRPRELSCHEIIFQNEKNPLSTNYSSIFGVSTSKNTRPYKKETINRFIFPFINSNSSSLYSIKKKKKVENEENREKKQLNVRVDNVSSPALSSNKNRELSHSNYFEVIKAKYKSDYQQDDINQSSSTKHILLNQDNSMNNIYQKRCLPSLKNKYSINSINTNFVEINLNNYMNINSSDCRTEPLIPNDIQKEKQKKFCFKESSKQLKRDQVFKMKDNILPNFNINLKCNLSNNNRVKDSTLKKNAILKVKNDFRTKTSDSIFSERLRNTITNYGDDKNQSLTTEIPFKRDSCLLPAIESEIQEVYTNNNPINKGETSNISSNLANQILIPDNITLERKSKLENLNTNLNNTNLKISIIRNESLSTNLPNIKSNKKEIIEFPFFISLDENKRKCSLKSRKFLNRMSSSQKEDKKRIEKTKEELIEIRKRMLKPKSFKNNENNVKDMETTNNNEKSKELEFLRTTHFNSVIGKISTDKKQFRTNSNQKNNPSDYIEFTQRKYNNLPEVIKKKNERMKKEKIIERQQLAKEYDKVK